MKWSANQCELHRQSLGLLASGALAEEERAEAEDHLTVCAGCQKYYDEIKRVTEPLANWEKSFAHIEPDKSLQMRWANAVAMAGAPKSVRKISLALAFRVWWGELIWPARRVWAGFAAVWLVLLAVNLTDSEEGRSASVASATPPKEVVLALKQQRQLLTELLFSAPPEPAEPPRRAPQPRSELQPVWMIG